MTTTLDDTLADEQSPTTTSQEPDPHRTGGFDPQPGVARISHATRARTLVSASGTATMCTLAADPSGYPFGSIATFLADEDGAPWVLISTMAEHTERHG